jgi:hypothetical protein
MYFAALTVHSLLRWVALALGLLAVASAFGDGAGARKRVLPFVIALDVQLLVGLLLYLALSPLTRSSGGGALRSYRVVHPAMAVGAVALGHVGNLLVKRPAREQRLVAGLVLLAALILLAALVPWDRPLLRY